MENRVLTSRYTVPRLEIDRRPVGGYRRHHHEVEANVLKFDQKRQKVAQNSGILAANGANVALTAKSRNAKTGRIPVTVSGRQTCPNSCPLKGDGGCYAEAGFHTRLHWDKVTGGDRGTNWTQFLAQVANLPEGQVWRHNVAGDLQGADNVIDRWALRELSHANLGRRGFTYTHYPMDVAENREAVRQANRDGFTVNLSADNVGEADDLADLGIAPVTVVLPADQLTNTKTPRGRTVVVCPAVVRDDVTCASCRLCQQADRSTIVGFPAHGPRKAVAATH